jgi:drug/metabolite transporter (DMT)-like permease
MAEFRRLHHFPRLQALFVTFLWSTSWVLIKLGLEEIPAISFAGLRYILAFLVIAPALLASAARRAELRSLKLPDWLRLSLLGVVFYSFTQGAQFLALAFLPAVTLSLILSFSPAAVALLGASFLGERLTRGQWLGVCTFLLGAIVYFLPLKLPLQIIGLVVAAIGLLANSWASLLGRSVNRRGDLHPFLVTVVSMGIGSVLLLAVGLIVEGVPHLDLSGWGIVIWLAVINTALAFTLWNHTLRSLTAIESTLINNTMLVQIAILAWLFLGEPISVREGAGLILAVLGALCVQLAGDRSKQAHPAPPPEHEAQADMPCCPVHAQAEGSHLVSNDAGEQIAFSSNNSSVAGKESSRATLRSWLCVIGAIGSAGAAQSY